LNERLNVLVQQFVKDYWEFIGSDVENPFKDIRASIEIPDLDGNKSIKLIYKFKLNFGRGIVLSGDIQHGNILHAWIHKDNNSYILSIDLKLLVDIPDKKHEDIQKITAKGLSRFLNDIVLCSLFELITHPLLTVNVWSFPSQRNTLILDFIKSAISITTIDEEEIVLRSEEDIKSLERQKRRIKKLSKPEKLIKSKPILDFLRLTDSLISSKGNKSDYHDLGQKLENLLGGNVIISEDGDIRFNINKDTSLRLITSSSMVQQLSSLTLYLKHVANLGDLIIVDEPESNLHPEAQAKLIEITAEIVNRGLWVIITTHSSFILEYLNALMKAYVIANMNDEAKKRVLEVIKNENALLNPENVGVYLFTKRGYVENVKKDCIIDLESFRRVADELGMKYAELLTIEGLYQKSIGVK